MDITVRSWETLTQRNRWYSVKVNVNGGMVEEGMLSQDEVDELSVQFLEDTLLDQVTRYGVVAKLIEAGVIDNQMIEDYITTLDS